MFATFASSSSQRLVTITWRPLLNSLRSCVTSEPKKSEVIALAWRTWPRWPLWRGATSPCAPCTRRWSGPGPRRSPCALAPSPARGGAWRSRWRSGGSGRGGHAPSRSRPGPAHALEDGAQHVDVGALAVSADEVGLPHPAAGEDGPHGAGVVVGMDPVADVAPVAVEPGAHPSMRFVAWSGMNFSTCW